MSINNPVKGVLPLIYIIWGLSLLFFFITFFTVNRNKADVKGVNVYRISKDLQIYESEIYKHYYEPMPGLKYYEDTFSSDSLNDAEYKTGKEPGIFRIITLGDSFTFGAAVVRFDNYPENLERMLNVNLSCGEIRQFEVINLGVYGYDLNYSLERYRKRGAKYNPDLVIWLLNDWNFNKYNEYYIPRDREIRSQLNITDDEDPRTLGIIRTASSEIREKFGKDFFEKNAKNVLTQMIELTEGRLIIITLQSLPENFKKIVMNMSTGNKFRLKNDLIIPSDKNLWIPKDWHPNSQGYKYIADNIFKYLLEKDLLKCDLKNY